MLLNDIQLTGLVLFPVAFLGTFFNWTVVFVIYKLPSFRHAFGYLSSSQAFADAIHSTVFMLYFCPMVITGSEFLTEYSEHCGFILLFSYELSVQTHLIISMNRFFAAWAPYKYKIMFSDRNTKIIIFLIFILTLGFSLTFYEVLCSLEYSQKTGFFFFTDTPLCNAIGWYADFCKYLTIIIIIVILDISTVWKVRSINKKVLYRCRLFNPNLIISQDVALSDNVLFQSIKQHLAEKKFKNVEILKIGVTNYFEPQPVEFFSRGIESLHMCCQ
ncbi:unnamed protein product [Caenorhabditis nigoni]